jgi:hypothetical protein
MRASKLIRLALTAGAGASLVSLAACGGGSASNQGASSATPSMSASASPSAAPSTSEGVGGSSQSGAVDPNAPEVVQPGDIPDNQVFVTYPWPDRTFTVDVPEGWSRTRSGSGVTFTDKYNSITVTEGASSNAPTVGSVKASGLADVSTDPTFKLGKVVTVSRKSGPGVLATYAIGSAPNQVTGKKALLAVERYFFAHNGHQVVLTLSGAKGADNVDPWRTVTDSLTWK